MLKRAVGPRPTYFSDPATDRLFVIVMTMAEELAVLRDRLDSFERVAETNGVVSRSEIEAFVPSASAADEREARRQEYVERLLRVVIEEAEQPSGLESVEEIVAAVSTGRLERSP